MQPVTTATLTEGFAERLQGEPIKHVAQKIGSNPYTVKNYKTGRNAPSLLQAIMLAREYADIRAWLQQMIEPPTDEQLAADLIDLKRRLAALEKHSAEKG